jgi:hypothetical protein
VTNQTGQLLEIQLSPLNNQRVLERRRIDSNAEKVHRSALGDGMTAHLQSHSTKAYLTVIAYLPTSGGRTFNIVENALVSRRREYVFELKHYNVALAHHDR